MKVIKNAYILNQNGDLEQMDVLIENEKITAIGTGLTAPTEIDANNSLLVPSFIDVHIHTRNPGQSYKESVDSICQAALAGGYSTLFAMPNTTPVIDDAQKLTEAINLHKQNTGIEFYHYAALSKNLVAPTPGDYKALKAAGAIALTNDGRGVQQEKSIHTMMQKCIDEDMIYVSHSEVDDLLFGGVMHAGSKSKELNLPGILSGVEAIAVAKEIMLATELACKYHICHISSKMSVDLLRLHKQYGSSVSGEVTPHHLILTDSDIDCDDPNYKMNPPLRSKSDRESLIAALNDGTIDIIATDHAPHSSEDKGDSFIGSAFGIVGLETAFDLLYTYLVKPGKVELKTIIDCMTINPAKRFGIEGGEIAVGANANITFIDLECEHTINREQFKSLGKNTPFDNCKVSSKIIKTMIKGEIVYE